MKKFISIFMAMALLFTMATAVLAADETVPSPKPKPEDTAPVDPNRGIIITHYDDIDNADHRVDTEKFQDAYDELKGAKDLSDLNDDIKDGATVRDLYDVTLVDEAKEEFEKNGKFTVTLDTDLQNDDYQVIIRGENGWKIVKDVKRNADGSLTLTLDTTGAVAVLAVPAVSGPNAPQTSDPMMAIIVCMAVVALAGGAVAYRRSKLVK